MSDTGETCAGTTNNNNNSTSPTPSAFGCHPHLLFNLKINSKCICIDL